MAALCSHVLFTSAEALHGFFTPKAYRSNFKILDNDTRVSVSARHAFICIQIKQQKMHTTLNTEFPGYLRKRRWPGQVSEQEEEYRLIVREGVL